MRFVVECPLRWSDMDAYGHVNNARFLTLYEEARVALMFDGARRAGFTSFEDGVVIARHEIDYLRPVAYATGEAAKTVPATVRVELWVEEIRPSRITLAYELYDGDALASRARTVLVPYDLTAQRPRRITDIEQEYLGAWQP